MPRSPLFRRALLERPAEGFVKVRFGRLACAAGGVLAAKAMAQPRYLAEERLCAGARLTLDAGRSRHAAGVLRLGVGDVVRVFNASDGEWRATIATADKRGVTLEVRELVRAPVAPRDLDLLFAPVKRQATDLIVEKATEMGAARLLPVLTARTIAETVRLERLSVIAREAAEQTERFEAPQILPPQTLAKALDGWDEARRLIYADESGDEPGAAWGGARGRAQPLLAALTALGPAAKLALLIGPEGGFAPEERAMLRGLPFVTPASLGPRILRAETAAIAALAVIQAAWGDWRHE